MTKPSDYVHWFDAVRLYSVRAVGRAVQSPDAAHRTEAPGYYPDVADLLTELGIDPTGVNPSNLLRTIAGASDVETTMQKQAAN